jgi:hypothetical protein
MLIVERIHTERLTMNKQSLIILLHVARDFWSRTKRKQNEVSKQLSIRTVAIRRIRRKKRTFIIP